MDVKLNERKCTVDPAVKAYAEKKVGKLERYFRGDAEASVTFRWKRRTAALSLPFMPATPTSGPRKPPAI